MVGYMNPLESWLVSSRPRAWLHWLELFALRKLGLDVHGKEVLEIGCGTGAMSALIADSGAGFALATDLEFPDVPNRRNLYASAHDATKMTLINNGFDAVVSICVLHHLTDWRKAVSEVTRVLRSGGQFAYIDWTASGLWVFDPFFDHPDGGRFTAGELRNELVESGFSVRQRSFAGLVFGCAEKVE